jgi:phytoene/squalene synthetase
LPQGGGQRIELHYSFLFLPPGHRRDHRGLCLLPRSGDVVDEVTDAISQAKLDWWRREVEALRRPARPPGHQAPQPIVRSTFGITRERWRPSSMEWNRPAEPLSTTPP